VTIDQTVRALLPEVREVRGSAGPGPTLAVLGGVHGNELLGVLAVRRAIGQLDPAALRGRIRWAAPAHPAAWIAERRAGPDDGLNLARVFPGDPAGAATERVADHLTEHLIGGADLLIDLHTAGAVSDMATLCGYHSTGPLATDAGAAAAAFGAPFTWEHPDLAPGRSLTAAETLGIPSIYVESAGGMVVRSADFRCYVDGLGRVMHHLGMVDRAPAPDGASIVVVGDGNTDGGITSPVDGYFVAAHAVGDLVAAGEEIGRIVDESGADRHRVLADGPGHLMLVRLTARVAPGDTLALIAAPR
jgi:predicted deacylase